MHTLVIRESLGGTAGQWDRILNAWGTKNGETERETVSQGEQDKTHKDENQLQ